MVTDVIIIGGGAAGLCSAVYLKQKAPSLSVRVLESLPRVGKKLALTGNGRCNISNKRIELSRYHGENVEFCQYALDKYNIAFTQEFFEKIGVRFAFEGDKAFPASFQAASVVDCLRFAAENLGVIINTETRVTNIQIAGGKYRVVADKVSFMASNIIIAAGLLSGGDRLGCDGTMLSLLKKAGFNTVKTTPAIVQVKTATDVVKQLKGIKINALATLKSGNRKIREEFGEVLFCDYGLSGPPILQVSRAIMREQNNLKIELDLMPEISENEIFDMLRQRAKRLFYLKLDEFFTGLLNKRVGQVILKSVGCSLSDKVQALEAEKIKKLAFLIKNFSFTVTGTTGFINSQVTAGGINTLQFDRETMMSKSNKGLYCVGEILDIDGDCGGFNLQWAWSSAFCAAESVLKEMKYASDK
ncbi:MAG: aminoacetone oxidase family FAD-binding enzyme [Clostridia bacterium]|nr:aminoacetone oxidase family FAD-binding enzyme [Clostridia bacterium]